jgi:hypothetical protein
MSEALKPIEFWALEQKTPKWLFAAAKIKYSWPIGREITLSLYLAAMQATLHHDPRQS